MSSTLLEQGLELMYYGMGTVFVFLTLLVLITSMMSGLIRRFDKPEVEAGSVRSDTGRATSEPSPSVVAAITAAVHEHRHNTRH